METVRLGNPCDTAVPPMEVRAAVDAGELPLRIPERIARRLRLEPVCRREITDADGRRRFVPYAGPVEVWFRGRQCYVGALVLGDEVSLGLLVLEEMDLTEPTIVRALK